MGSQADSARAGWLLTTSLIALVALAQGPGDEPVKLRAIEFLNHPSHLAISVLAARHGAKVEIDPGIQGTASLSLRDITPEKAFQILLGQIGATSSLEGDTLHVRLLRPSTSKGRPGDEVDTGSEDFLARRIPRLKLDKIEILDALEELFAQQDASFMVDPDVVGKVSCDLRGRSFEQCLQMLTRQIDATYRVEGSVFQIVTRPTGCDGMLRCSG